MELRALRYFLSVLENGSVGAAARAHYVTQPAVSLQIKKLEEEVGESLFERRGRGLVPTTTAREIAAAVEAIVRQVDELEDAVRGIASLERGRLRIGGIDAASVYILPDVYRAFHRRHPGVRLEIMVDATRSLLAALAAGEIEMAATTLPIPDAGYRILPIFRERLLPVVHPSHPLAHEKRVGLGELSEHAVITYPAGSTTRRLIDAVFTDRRQALRATMELSSPEAMRRLTQAGLGVSILPESVVSADIGRRALTKLDLTGRVRFERSIGMVYRDRATLGPAARVFLDMVEAQFAPKSGR